MHEPLPHYDLVQGSRSVLLTSSWLLPHDDSTPGSRVLLESFSSVCPQLLPSNPQRSQTINIPRIKTGLSHSVTRLCAARDNYRYSGGRPTSANASQAGSAVVSGGRQPPEAFSLFSLVQADRFTHSSTSVFLPLSPPHNSLLPSSPLLRISSSSQFPNWPSESCRPG